MSWVKPCGGIEGEQSSKRFFQNNSTASGNVHGGVEGFLKVQMPNRSSKGSLSAIFYVAWRDRCAQHFSKTQFMFAQQSIHLLGVSQREAPSPTVCWACSKGEQEHSSLLLQTNPSAPQHYLKIGDFGSKLPDFNRDWKEKAHDLTIIWPKQMFFFIFYFSFFNFASSSGFQFYPSCWLEFHLALAFPLPPSTHFFILAPFSPFWEQNLVPALCPRNQSSS